MIISFIGGVLCGAVLAAVAILLIYAQAGIDDMATEKCTIGVKVKTRWFFKPALMMAMAYVWIGGSARSASNFIGKYCFDIKVIK